MSNARPMKRGDGIKVMFSTIRQAAPAEWSDELCSYIAAVVHIGVAGVEYLGAEQHDGQLRAKFTRDGEVFYLP